MIPHKALMRGGLQPIPVWAVGYYTGSDGLEKPVCYHKPKNGPWQLQYIGADVGYLVQSKFFAGHRRKGAPAGTIYVSNLHADRNPGQLSASFCCAAKSDDFGVSWTRFHLDTSVFAHNLLINAQTTLAVCSPADNVVVSVVGAGGSWNPEMYRGTGGNMFDVVLPPGRNTCGWISDFICFDADQTPTKTAVLKCFAGFNQALELWTSTDLGASWFVEAVLATTDGLRNANNRGSAAITADKKQAVVSDAGAGGNCELWYSTDLANWTRSIAGVAGNPNPFGAGCGGIRQNKWAVSNAKNTVYITSDGGMHWSAISRAFRRMRFLGDAFYGVSGGTVSISRNGGITWTVESLPPSGTGPITFTDIFG